MFTFGTVGGGEPSNVNAKSDVTLLFLPTAHSTEFQRAHACALRNAGMLAYGEWHDAVTTRLAMHGITMSELVEVELAVSVH